MKAYLFALITACIWGIVPIMERMGLTKIQVLPGLLIRSCGVIVGAILLIIFRTQTLKAALATDTKTFLYLFGGGILASFFGQFFFYQALKNGQASKVVPLAATYPLITFLIAVFFLHEQVTFQKVMGMLLVISGVLLLK